MIELRRTRWIKYTRTARSLRPGEQGRGWLRTDHPTVVDQPPQAADETGSDGAVPITDQAPRRTKQRVGTFPSGR